MNDEARATHILSIDDDPDIRDLIEHSVEAAGFEIESAPDGPSGIDRARAHPPALILLDVMMPAMDGYEVCRRLQADSDLSHIPVVFLTALGDEQDKAKAFAAGAVDYMVKPFRPAALVEVINTHLKTAVRWQELSSAVEDWSERLTPSDFLSFREQLVAAAGEEPGTRARLSSMRPEDMYTTAESAGIGQSEMGQMLADYLKIPRVTAIDPRHIDLGALPAPFCRKNLVVPIRTANVRGLVVANPFNWELLETIQRFADGTDFKLSLAEPRVITALLTGAEAPASVAAPKTGAVHSFSDPVPAQVRPPGGAGEPDAGPADANSVTVIANRVIVAAAQQGASDITIEPRADTTSVRFRVDGDLRDFITLKWETATMLISRFKALSGLDIAEKRKPQDGSMDAEVEGSRYKLRLATTSTPEGESLIVRLLEVSADARLLTDLGFTRAQSDKLTAAVRRNNGLILVVGTTGSGKTTTIYSLMSAIDGTRRSILTIEDPVEYQIPFANQQQVNEKAGVSFESLLRSVVRQDPDVLFLGEIRDAYSAKVTVDFASTGHLTITTLHTADATTAVLRLEHLGVTREVMADALRCIVAQRLVRRLCDACRGVGPITEEERGWLEPFTDAVPEMVARPVGCAACGGTGYRGRDAVAEIIDVDGQIQSMIRAGAPVAELRAFQRGRGDYLMYDHAIEKVRALTVAPADAYEAVLVEELAAMRADARERSRSVVAAPSAEGAALVPEAPGETRVAVPRILLVEDDEDARTYVQRILERGGYQVTLAGDGATALMMLGRERFDLIVADVQMPMLDGFALLEIIGKQAVATPVIMLTGSDAPDDEARGLQLGAADYIHKPARQDVLLARVARVLAMSQRDRPA